MLQMKNNIQTRSSKGRLTDFQEIFQILNLIADIFSSICYHKNLILIAFTCDNIYWLPKGIGLLRIMQYLERYDFSVI